MANLSWVIGVVVVATALIVWSCARSVPLARWRWVTLASLRVVMLLAVAILLLRPTLRVTFDRTVRPSLPILIDGTESMSIADTRVDRADLIRAGIVDGSLDPAGGLDQQLPPTTRPAPTRESLIQSAFKNPRLDLLPTLQKRFDLRPYLLADTLTELGDPNWTDHLTDTGTTTPLGDDLAELLARTRGRPVAGIVVVTDGRNNAGSPPRAAAELAKSQGVKLFIYGVGTVDPKDIVVSAVYAPEIAFVNDTVPVTVRVTGVGLAGEHATLVLKLGNSTVAQKQITFDGAEQSILIPVTPATAGSFDLTASIAPRPDETVKENNTAKTALQVTDKKIRVLLVDSSPRWEFKYVLATLLNDRRVEAHCLLQDGDPGTSGNSGPYIKSFPANRAELLDHYDLLILGDIDPAVLSNDQMSAVTDFVSKFGGGLLVVPGRRYGLQSMAALPIGAMLPVTPGAENRGSGTAAIHLQLTPAGRRSPTLKLAPDDQDSARIWSQLPPIYWDVPVTPKPAAEVLLVDPGTDKNHPNPVLAVQQYGLGQVMFLGTDNTWRWRQNSGEKSYAAFWGQLVQRLALPHLLGQNRRTQLSLDKKIYSVGDTVTVYGRLYDQGFIPLTDPSVPGTFTTGDRTTPIALKPVVGEPGVFRGSFVAAAAGGYELRLDRDAAASLKFDVTRASPEFTDSALDEAGLKELARITGGRFFREEDLHDLPAAIAADVESVRSTADIDLGASPVWFALILLLATVEWVLRKVFQLK